MKSRRRASAAQSSVKATVAWRPCVSTSSRSVVTSVGDVGRDHRDGAVRQAGRHRREARGSGRRDHLLGARGGGDVDVDDGPVQQRVAHGAADGAGREAGCGERGEHGLRLTPRKPIGPGKARQRVGRRGIGHGRLCYFSWPGSMRPSLPMRGGV